MLPFTRWKKKRNAEQSFRFPFQLACVRAPGRSEEAPGPAVEIEAAGAQRPRPRSWAKAGLPPAGRVHARPCPRPLSPASSRFWPCCGELRTLVPLAVLEVRVLTVGAPVTPAVRDFFCFLLCRLSFLLFSTSSLLAVSFCGWALLPAIPARVGGRGYQDGTGVKKCAAVWFCGSWIRAARLASWHPRWFALYGDETHCF